MPTFQFTSAQLRVASLDRAEAFYAGALGLLASRSVRGELVLRAAADSAPLLTLREIPGLASAPDDAPGLFHLALLLPTRTDLGRVLRRLAAQRTPLQGLSDHGVSEAIYLADPDGNGLELYSDRPRADWPQRAGKLTMFTRPLDVPNLLSASPDDRAAGLPAGTTLGHVHLRVASLPEAERFATTDLPLEVVTRDYPGAIFFSADGYHHHLATNTWGVRPAGTTANHAGLDSVQAVVSGLASPQTLTGPAGIVFQLQPAPATVVASAI